MRILESALALSSITWLMVKVRSIGVKRLAVAMDSRKDFNNLKFFLIQLLRRWSDYLEKTTEKF